MANDKCQMENDFAFRSDDPVDPFSRLHCALGLVILLWLAVTFKRERGYQVRRRLRQTCQPYTKIILLKLYGLASREQFGGRHLVQHVADKDSFTGPIIDVREKCIALASEAHVAPASRLTEIGFVDRRAALAHPISNRRKYPDRLFGNGAIRFRPDV